MFSAAVVYIVLFANELLKLLLPLLAVALVGFAVQLFRRGEAWLKANLSQAQLSQIADVIKILVLAAEQSGFKDALLANGQQKKTWVISESQRILAERGLGNIDVNLLSSLVEATVLDELNRLREFEEVVDTSNFNGGPPYASRYGS